MSRLVLRFMNLSLPLACDYDNATLDILMQSCIGKRSNFLYCSVPHADYADIYLELATAVSLI
jgi:hypothetical protein